MACASPPDHAHEANTQLTERHKYREQRDTCANEGRARAVTVRVYKAQASDAVVVATRAGEVGRGEVGDRGLEAGDGHGLEELGVSADQLVGLGVLTAQASRQGGSAARGQREHVRSSSQQRRRANQAP